jgi:hypothetical protein
MLCPAAYIRKQVAQALLLSLGSTGRAVDSNGGEIGTWLSGFGDRIGTI